VATCVTNVEKLSHPIRNLGYSSSPRPTCSHKIEIAGHYARHFHNCN
jgi:hypothetical protein